MLREAGRPAGDGAFAEVDIRLTLSLIHRGVSLKKLKFVQALINAAAIYKFVMRSRFRDGTAVENDDSISPAYRGEAVCDHDDGPVGHEVRQRLLHQRF